MRLKKILWFLCVLGCISVMGCNAESKAEENSDSSSFSMVGTEQETESDGGAETQEDSYILEFEILF